MKYNVTNYKGKFKRQECISAGCSWKNQRFPMTEIPNGKKGYAGYGIMFVHTKTGNVSLWYCLDCLFRGNIILYEDKKKRYFYYRTGIFNEQHLGLLKKVEKGTLKAFLFNSNIDVSDLVIDYMNRNKNEGTYTFEKKLKVRKSKQK